MPNGNAIIARWLAAHGHPELAWEPAKTCPQGHSLGRVDIGGLCSRCADDYLMSHESLSYYGEAVEEMQRMPDAVKRMWLIEAVPKDFAQPAPLLAAVRTFVRTRTQDGSFWSYQTSWRPDEARAEIREEIIESWGFEIGRGYAEEDPSDEYKALRAALAAAMEGEKGGESTHV